METQLAYTCMHSTAPCLQSLAVLNAGWVEAYTQPHANVLQVRSLAESTGEVSLATPSLAVQMVGLNSVPTAGDEFYVCADETMARKAAEVAEDAQVPLQPADTTYSTVVRTTIPKHCPKVDSQGGQPFAATQMCAGTSFEDLLWLMAAADGTAGSISRWRQHCHYKVLGIDGRRHRDAAAPECHSEGADLTV